MVAGAGSTSLLKTFNACATFAVTLVLARALGVNEFGKFSFAMSIVTLLGVFAKFGADQVIVRHTALFHSLGDWRHIHGLLRFGVLAVVAASGVCVAGGTGVFYSSAVCQTSRRLLTGMG